MALRAACRYGHLACVELLLRSAASTIVLDLASKSGAVHIVDHLLRTEGAHDVESALGFACGQGSVSCTRLLLQHCPPRPIMLIEACGGGHTLCAEALLGAAPSLSTRKALNAACAQDRPSCVRLLLDANEPRDDDALRLAAKRDARLCVELMLERRPPADDELASLASAASQEDAPEALEALLARLAKVAPHKIAETRARCLVKAAERGATRCTRLLLPNTHVDTEWENETPLLAAAASGSEDTLRVLLDAGADVDLEVGRRTALQVACQQGDAVAAQLLLDHRATVTPYALLASVNTPGCLVLLLEHGGEGLVDHMPVLDRACRVGYVDSVDRLLRAGVDPNARDASDGHTVLMSAAVSSNEPCSTGIVGALLDAGADPVTRMSNGHSVVDAALAGGPPSTAALLVRRCPGVVELPLTVAVQHSRDDIVSELAHEASADDVEQALLCAVGQGTAPAMVDLLLMRCAALTEPMVERALLERVKCARDTAALLAWLDGRPPRVGAEARTLSTIIGACERCSEPHASHIAWRLLRRSRGELHGGLLAHALKAACARSLCPSIEVLLSAGADPDAPLSAEGMTALMHAARGSTAECVAALLYAGARVDVRDALGRTALWHAIDAGSERAGFRLVDAGAPFGHEEAEASRGLPKLRRRMLDALLPEEDEDDVTELRAAVRHDHARWLRRELRRGSRGHAAATTELLDDAVLHDSPGAVRELLEAGAPIGALTLAIACEKGHVRCASLLLAHGGAPLGDALSLACLNGHAECVALLLRAGAVPDDLDLRQAHESLFCTRLLLEAPSEADASKALEEACESGSFACAELLVPRASTREPALVEACVHGDDALVALLLAAGATGDSEVLEEAAIRSKTSLCYEQVVRAKLVPPVPRMLDMTEAMLHTLLSSGFRCRLEEVIKATLWRGKHTHLRLLLDADPMAARNLLPYAADDPVATRELLAAGADVDARDRRDLTALMKTCAMSGGEVAVMLLEANANPHLQADSDDYDESVTALDLACVDGNVPCVRALLHAGARVNAFAITHTESLECLELLLASSPDSSTLNSALEVALHTCKPAVVQRLLEAGADVEKVELLKHREKDMETTVKLLVRHRGVDAVLTPRLLVIALREDARLLEALLRAGAPMPPLRHAKGVPLALGANSLRVLLRAGVVEARELLPLVGAASEECARLLLDVASHGNEAQRRVCAEQYAEVPTSVETVRVLLEAGADVVRMLERASPDRVPVVLAAWPEGAAHVKADGQTALHLASGSPSCVHELVAGGLDPHARDGHQRTPLMAAVVRSADGESVRLLLRMGADANASDAHGRTALMHGAEGGRVQGTRALLDAGAAVVDVEARDALGWSALMLAAANGHAQLMRELLNAGARHEGVPEPQDDECRRVLHDARTQ